MKYLCLGYTDEERWNSMTEPERLKFIDECFTYDDELRKGGHFAGGEALQSARSAAILRWQNGSAFVTDGPFTEAKEQIGGIMVLEARDLNHAIQLMARHPSLRLGSGPWEIRPVADLSAMITESEARRAARGDSDSGTERQQAVRINAGRNAGQ